MKGKISLKKGVRMYKIGTKVMAYVIITEIIVNEKGTFYVVKPDEKEAFMQFMRVKEDNVTSSNEILTTMDELNSNELSSDLK